MQDDEEKTVDPSSINLDALEEVLGDDSTMAEEDEDIMIKISSFDSDDDELDIAFTDDDGDW